MKQLQITMQCSAFTVSQTFNSDDVSKQVKWMETNKKIFLKGPQLENEKLSCTITHMDLQPAPTTIQHQTATPAPQFSQGAPVLIDGQPYMLDVQSNVFRKQKGRAVLTFSAVAEMCHYNILQVDAPVLNFITSEINKNCYDLRN